MAKHQSGKPKKQVAALGVARDEEGALRVLVITSRETRRFILPKGWPMKGIPDHKAAEIEAREEAGLVGHAHPKPIGSFLAWKRRQTSFQLVKTKVFLVDVLGTLETWKEQGQRSIAWLKVEDAALLVDEPGLVDILRKLPARLPKSWRTRAADIASLGTQFGDHPVIGTPS